MKHIKNIIILTAALAAMSCTTVNYLDEYEIEGKAMALELAPSRPPEVDVHYNWTNSGSPLVKMIVFTSNVAKASEAARAEKKLFNALQNERIPEMVANRAYEASLSTLDTYNPATGSGDLLMVISVEEYGIREGYSGALFFFMKVDARIYHEVSKELIWRRVINENEQASPAIFGFPALIDSIVTISMLDDLDEEQLAIGIRNLADSSASRVAQKLHDDYMDTRYRD